jgi:SAM-dependent methyltransferase
VALESAPDELALAGAEHLDPEYVARYERKAQFDPAEDLQLLRSLGLGPGSTLIDFGAGTGVFALAVAPFCKRVIAVDVSRPMLEALQARAATNIECVQAGFLSYEHEGGPVDFVYSRNALHHLPDLWKGVALQRVAELLVPGGILRLRDLVFSFGPDEVEAGIARWIDAAAAGRPEDGWTREELLAHVSNEHSTFTWLLEALLDRAGLEVVSADYAAVGAYAAYVCRRRALRD